MSGFLSRSSYKLSNKNNFVNEEYHSIDLLEKKNITDNNNNIIININNNKINSLRRTSSSADMSSEKWAQNNGVSVIKRVQSSENLQSLGEKNNYVNEDIVNNNDIDNKENCGGAAFEDIWSSILSGKKPVEAGSGDPAPYVHPLVKRASSLSEKSLEICTESLGSETGSDGFSNPLTDPGDGQEGEEEVCGDEVEVVRKNDDVVVEVVSEKYNYNINVVNSKKVNVGVERSFPPPLPSLVNCDGGSNLHLRTRRHGGRVVVEAVAVSTPQCFRAQREDGRLLLTFSGDNDSAENEQESNVELELESELESKLNFEPEPKQFSDELVQKVDESSPMSWAPKVISVTIQASKAMSMNKLIELTCSKSQSMWPRASNMTFVKSLENEHAELARVEESPRQKLAAHSLSPRPRVTTTITTPATLNEYEYYWRNSSNSTAAVTVFKPLAGKQNNYFVDSVSPQVVKESNKRMNKFLLGNNEKGGEQEKVVLVGEEEYLVPFFRGCKESRRSLFFWEPYCIATS